jgi:hypothetical protein
MKKEPIPNDEPINRLMLYGGVVVLSLLFLGIAGMRLSGSW